MFNELNDGVVDDVLSGGVATFALVYLEAQEVAVAGQCVQLIANGCRFTSDDRLPGRPSFEPHHGLIDGQLTTWEEVVAEGLQTAGVERFDFVDGGVFDACWRGLRNVKVAEQLVEAVAREGIDSVLLSVLSLPVHVHLREVDDAHEDVN